MTLVRDLPVITGGTVTFTSGSRTVNGSSIGSLWRSTRVNAGVTEIEDSFGRGAQIYPVDGSGFALAEPVIISGVVSATELQLLRPWAGATISATAYRILPAGNVSQAIASEVLRQAAGRAGPSNPLVQALLENGTRRAGLFLNTDGTVELGVGDNVTDWPLLPRSQLIDPNGRFSATDFGPRLIVANSNIAASSPKSNLYKTLNEAVNAAAAMPWNGTQVQAVIKCIGVFDEQISRLPAYVHLVGEALGSWVWKYTGSRSTGNFLFRYGFANYVGNVLIDLTLDETHRTVVVDNDSKFCHLDHYKILSPAPGGDVVVQGLGRAKAITIERSDWPCTFLESNGFVDCDRSTAGGAVEIISTSTGETGTADIRSRILNIDTLFASAAGSASLLIDGVKDVWLIAPQILGNISSNSDSAIIMRRTNPTAGLTELHLVGQGVAGFTSPVEVNSNCKLIAEYGTTSVPVVLNGSGELTMRGEEGELIVRTSPDAYSVRNAPGPGVSVTQTRSGSIKLNCGVPPSTSPLEMFYALRPLASGAINIQARLKANQFLVDDFWRFGLVMRNPTGGAMKFFGVRGGNLLVLEEWSNNTTITNANVVPARSLNGNPEYFGIFRDSAGDANFELRDATGSFVQRIGTITGCAAFTQIGIGAATENIAGAGVGVVLICPSFVVNPPT
jgi:hypothetical protein